MRAARPAPSLCVVLACVAVALAGCGKGAASGAGPTPKVAPVTPAGAVSVVTRNTTRLGGADAATDAAAVARAVYPGLTSATRPQLVVLVDSRDWPAALAASELAGAPLAAPILYSTGDALPSVSLEALEALDPTGAPALAGTQVLRIGTTAAVPKQYLTRSLPSAPAPEIAATLAQLMGSAGAPARHQAILLPSGAAPTLQMPAAGLAAQSGAPILFATPGRLPAATVAALTSLRHPAVYVLDAGAVDGFALRELAHLGTVTEITGSASGEQAGPSASSIAVARFTDGRFGWGVKEPGHGLVFASDLKPLDAPAAALLSATANYGPLLLLEGAHQIPAALAAYLGDIQPAYNESFDYRPVRGVYNHGWLIGDANAISAVTQAEIDTLLEISPSRGSSSEASSSQVE
jgi:hypothetical protein